MGLTINFDLSEALARDNSPPGGRPGWLPPGVLFRDWAWGKFFATCIRLRTFTLVIDALEEFKDAMEQHVQWASRTWQLPLNPNNNGGYQYLSADGNPIQRTSWRGPNIYWLKHCVKCDVEIRLPNSECEEHTRIETLFRKGLGPRIYTWTITFTARTYRKRWSLGACYLRSGAAPPHH